MPFYHGVIGLLGQSTPQKLALSNGFSKRREMIPL